MSEKQILRIVAGLFRTLVVVFVLPNGKQHSRSNLRKGEQDEDYGNHNRETTDRNAILIMVKLKGRGFVCL